MKNKFLFFVAIATFCLLSLQGFGQKTIWGGKGHVSFSSAQVVKGASLKIDYLVSESRGTGTADFRCEVTTPDGVIFIAKKSSTTWENGTAKATFNCPSSFRGNDDVKLSTNTPGNYLVQCYWYIDGYGVNGKVAAGSGVFIVK